MRYQARWSIVVVGVALLGLCLVGLLDWWVGQSLKRDLSVLPLYLGPIGLAAWLLRGRAWVGIVFVAALMWFMAQVLDPSLKERDGLAVLAFNGAGRMLVFATFGWMTARLRSHQTSVEDDEPQDAIELLSREDLYLAMSDPGRLSDSSTPPSAMLLIDIERPLTSAKGGGREHGVLVTALVVSTMRECARAGDFCARLNDEQFIIVMPRTHAAAAQGVADALRVELPRLRDSLKRPFTLTTLLCTSATLSVDTPELLRHAEASLMGSKASAPGGHSQTTLERSTCRTGGVLGMPART